MSPRQLTDADKRTMQDARVRTRDERKAARKVLAGNPQFTNPKFWVSIDAGVLSDVDKAMEKAKRAVKAKKILDLEEQIAALRGQLQGT